MTESNDHAADHVRRRLGQVHDQIVAAGGDPDRVAVLAVTKGFGPDAARAALAVGLHDLGENYAQELHDKAGVLAAGGSGSAAVGPSTPVWHFIGQLQSNKVRQIAPLVSCWQSVDRASLVVEIAKRAPGAAVMVQVNAGGEGHKGGCPVDEVPSLVDTARGEGLEVRGLMTVGIQDDRLATATAFTTVRGVADDLGLAECSMGMTADIDLAVAAGSTMIRVGTALFGSRPPR